MSRFSRVTISLPSDLVQAIDERLTNGEETRSAVIRRLIEDALRKIEEREQVEQWVRSYQDCPQTEEEIGWAAAATLRWAAENPY